MAASAPTWPPVTSGYSGSSGPAVGAPVVGLEPGCCAGGALPFSAAAPPAAGAIAEFIKGPVGLAQALLEGRAATPVRFWVVDNSGSMATPDGSRLMSLPRAEGFRVVQSTRWEELRDVVLMHARLALGLHARVDFHLLNPPSHYGARQYISLGGPEAGSHGDGAATLRDLEVTMGTGPTGSTPLTESIVTIHSLVEGMAPSLRAAGSQAVVVLATDGLPNDPNTFVQALINLQRLGCVWVVVRLCTQSEEVLEYWNDLDRQLEAPLEVLDDATAEAREIAQANPWLTYGFPLHLLRTAGVRHKLFDLMDEQAFIGSQLSDMCSLLFGCGPLPNPEADWLGFQERLGGLLAATPRIFCPVARELRPWVDLKVLREKFGRSVKRPMFGPAPDASLSAFPPASLSPPPPPLTEPWVFLTLSATKLEKKDTWSKNDPFFTISYWAGEVGQSILLANSDAIQNKKKPEWKSMYFARSALQPWDPSPAGRLRFDVFDFEDDHKHQAIGHCWTSVEELLERREAELQLTSPRGGGKVSGLLTIKAGSVS
mmetsp:Transcript_537/g.1622  ORF Transcript_537/g.1622 Transcript_537/m.1622 type:complete len:543 (-) Transcript_537:86-1714(-)